MNVAVFGAKGRVGQRVAAIALQRGHNVWQIDKQYEQNPLRKVDVTVNFATADAIYDVVAFCRKHRCPLVNGATGLDENQQDALNKLSGEVKVVSKSNFAEGVDMMLKLCDIVSRELGWDCAVVETHRKGKKDAPSGTARSLISTITNNLGSFRSVEAHSLRLGDCVGKHEAVFAADGQSLTITHEATSVDVFALGAIETARRIVEDKEE